MTFHGICNKSLTVTFKDIFKTSFLDKIGSVSFLDMIIALGLAFVTGLFIFYVYKRTYKGALYSKSFGVSLLALSMITSLVILAVTSNVVLSLGMVGALSIVRFRTAIKDPLDIVFLFWSIAAGIVLGAGLIPLALIGSLFIGLILILFVEKKPGHTPYILVLGLENETVEQQVLQLLKQRTDRYLVKSKTVSPETGIELTAEIRLKDETTYFVNELAALPGVRQAALVNYSGAYAG